MRRGFVGFLVAAFLTLVAQDAPAQQAETRIALIIANETYAGGNFQALPGTRADAAVMQDALRRAGFTVTVRSNVNRQAMREAIAGFARQLAAAGNRGVGFFYYSGHGVGQRNENYLIPVDAHVEAITDLPLQGVPLSEQLEAIELSGAKATIIVLDACRTTFGRGSRGLALVAARTDTLIAYSTQPGELANDDGLYARSLAAEMATPGADATEVFTRVTRRVAVATNRQQVPRVDSGLIDPLVFVPLTVVAVTAAPVALTPQQVRPDTPPTPTSSVGVRPSRCSAPPALPNLPDGATATQPAMQAGTANYNTWATAIQTVIACRATEVRDLEALFRERASEHNTAAAYARNLFASWEGEIAEFNARPANSRSTGADFAPVAASRSLTAVATGFAPSRCANILELPSLPNGATASRSAMTAGTTVYNSWATNAQAALDCRNSEYHQLETESRVRAQEHNALVASARTTMAAWEAEITEFNARHPARAR